MLVAILFWGSLAGLAYIYAGYPLLMAGLARVWPMSRNRVWEPRRVSVVLSVHHEAARLPYKLKSLFELDHADLIEEILIGSDGSTDDTVSLLQAWQDPRVRVIPFETRRGKPAILNELIPLCRGEIVLLTDARQEFDREFLSQALANFADPTVGVVSGELVLRAAESDTTAAEGIGLYWRYEKFLRKAESRFRGVPGATGACYLIRRDRFRPIPAGTILDDVAIPLSIVELGMRCVFEPGALAFDRPSQSPRQEAIRKRRTIAGAAQLLRLYPRWLVPWKQPLWFEYLSHKVLRLVSPALLLTVLVTNLWLAATPPYGVLLSLQFAFYVMAACGWAYQRWGWKSRVFGPSLMFLTLNLTTLAALWDALWSRYHVTWKKST